MENGLYKVQFQTPMGLGFGVVTVRDGTIQGGDARLFYIGTFQQEGNAIKASVQTDAHTDLPGIKSVFGIDRVNITLSGTADSGVANVVGRAAEAPGLSFQATLTKIAA